MKLKCNNARRGTVAAAISAAMLAACGGGGGDSGGPGVVVPQTTRSVAASAGSDATAANAAALGGWLARAVLSVSGDGAFGIAATRESAQALGPGAANVGPMQARVLLAALRRGVPHLAANEQPAAVRTDSETCVNGGSLLVTADDADNNNKLSRGDVITAVASNCVLDSAEPAATGTLRLTINAVEFDSSGEAIALDVSAAVTDFSVAGYGSYNGNIRLWNKPEGTGERTRVSFRATSVAYAGTTVVFDFDIYGLDGAQSSFDLNGGLGIGGQTYAVVGSTALIAVGSSPPASGSLQLRDAAGDTVRLTARNTSTFDLEFLPAGAAVPAVSLPGLRWADYLDSPQ